MSYSIRFLSLSHILHHKKGRNSNRNLLRYQKHKNENFRRLFYLFAIRANFDNANATEVLWKLERTKDKSEKNWGNGERRLRRKRTNTDKDFCSCVRKSEHKQTFLCLCCEVFLVLVQILSEILWFFLSTNTFFFQHNQTPTNPLKPSRNTTKPFSLLLPNCALSSLLA